MNKASLGSRFIALIIDNIVIAILAWILSAVFGSSALGGIASFVLAVLYNGYFWTTRNGQTPGKQMMNIRVVKTNGAALTWTDAVIRVVNA